MDIKNAFNTASWRIIFSNLEERGIGDYLRDTIVEVDRNHSMKVNAGVPQGSILGLWNILYDGVFNLEIPHRNMLVKC